MKTQDELVTSAVIEVCKQIALGLVTITEGVLHLLAEDCSLISFSENKFVISCYSDYNAWAATPYDVVETVQLPEHFTIEL